MAAPQDSVSEPGVVDTTLPAEPGAAPVARGVVEEHCDLWGLGPLCDDAALIVTELVANAVRHAGTAVHLRLRRQARGIRLEVTDGSTRPARRRATTPLDDGGRGLALVDALATRYGVAGRPDGKTVWAELHVA